MNFFLASRLVNYGFYRDFAPVFRCWPVIHTDAARGKLVDTHYLLNEFNGNVFSRRFGHSG